jgi:hypothetical protein
MNILKSILSGLATLTLAALACEAPLFLRMMKYRATFSEPFGDGYYVVVQWHIWPMLSISVLTFAAGFFWQYHRTR